MSEVVDSIVAELIAKTAAYEAGFDRAIAKNDRFKKSVKELQALGGSPIPQQYSERLSKAVTDGANAHEKAADRIKRAVKSQSTEEIAAANNVKAAVKSKTDAEKLAAKESAAAAREAARAKIAAAKEVDVANKAAAASAAALAAKQAQIEANSARRTIHMPGDNPGLRPAVGGRVGSTVANEPTGQKTIPLAVLNGGAAPVAAEAEINHLLADRFDLTAKAAVAEGSVKRELKDEVEWLRRIEVYKRAGLSDSAAQVRAESEIAAIEQLRAKNEAKKKASQTAKFAEGAGLGRGGNLATIGGIAAAAGVTAVVSLAKAGLDYAHDLKIVSEQIGITTKDLQVYQTVAADVGMTQEQLRTSLGQLSTNLGLAQAGSEEQAKVFKGLGIDIGNAKDGYKSLSDVLPTLVERLSSITDKTIRNAIETRLGGEQLRKLDPILSGGTANLDKLSDAMERTGTLLSSEDIARSAKVAQDLQRVGDQLERQLASTVAQNAAAIENLATAFLNAASAALKFFDAMKNNGDRFTLNNEDRDLGALLTGSDPNKPVQDSFQAQLRTPEGRATLFQRNVRQTTALAGLVSGKELVPDQAKALDKLQELNPGASAKQIGQRLAKERDAITGAATAGLSDIFGSGSASAQSGHTGNLGGIFAPKGPKGAKGKTADQTEAQRLERAKKFAADEARLQDERLSLLSDLTADTRVQDEYQRERIRSDRDAKDTEFKAEAEATILKQKLNGSDADEVRARAKTLIGLNDSNAELELRGINRRELARFNDEELASSKIAAGIKTDELNSQLALARTAKERHEIETRLLALAAEQERQALQKQVDDATLDPRSREDARTQLRALPSKTAGQQARIDKQNQGPLAAYIDSLPKTAADLDEAFQKAAVHGLTSLNDGLSSALDKMLGLHGAAGDFLSDLIKIGLQMLQQKAFSAAQPGGGGFAGLISGIGSLFGGGGFTTSSINTDAALAGIKSTPGFAGGGSGVISGNPGVDRNMLSLNGNPIARVGHGELLSISPNVAASNSRVRQQTPNVIVLQPIKADFSGARTDEQTMRDFTSYADARSRQAYDAAVATAGQQAGGILSRQQTFKG